MITSATGQQLNTKNVNRMKKRSDYQTKVYEPVMRAVQVQEVVVQTNPVNCISDNCIRVVNPKPICLFILILDKRIICLIA